MPCQCTLVTSGSLLVTKMRYPVAFDGLDRRTGTGAVVAPEVGVHAGGNLAHHRPATRWNSLTPSSCARSDQPLRVTSGLNGRPFGGEGGTCVFAAV